MFAELPVQSVAYNHAAGRVVVTFRAGRFQAGCPVSLLVDGTAHNSTGRHVAARGKTPEHVVAIFGQIRLASVSQELLLISHIGDRPAFYRYIPDQHDLLHWKAVDHDDADLTVLLSFPRSGSNFLQNVIRHNTEQVGCASIYQDLKLAAPKILLKSHTLSPGVLRTELATLWGIEKPGFKRIVLIRDPRDIFISLYDYVTVLRGADIDPAAFLMTDFYWYLYKPHMIGLVRGRQARALNVLQAYRTWFRTWIPGLAQNPDTLLVRFERLVASPADGFAPVFRLLDRPMPKHLAAMSDLVSQNGESTRRRGRAQGWREAPDMYRPIIDEIGEKLADEIAYLGYEGKG